MFRASPDDAAGLSVSDGLSDYYLPGMEPELIASSATSRAPRLRAGAHALALAEVCALVARGEYLEAERSLADIKEGRIIGQDPHAITFAWQAVLELVGKHLIPAEKKAAEMGYLRSGGVTYLERLLDTLDTRTKAVLELSSRMYVAPEMSGGEMEGLCEDLQHFTAVRRLLNRTLTELFNQSHDAHTPKLIALASAFASTEEERSLGMGRDSPVAPMCTALAAEKDTVECLLRAHIGLRQADFKNTMMWLFKAKQALSHWRGIFQRRVGKGSAGRVVAASSPLAHEALRKVQALLTSKATLYFHVVVGRPMTHAQAKVKRGSKPPITSDFFLQRLVSFQRTTNADFVCMVLNSAGSKYNSAGYVHPLIETGELQGMKSYPVVFSYPLETVPHGSPIITIVTTVMENASKLRHDGVGAVQFACVPRFGELVKFDEGNYNSSKTDEKSVYFFKCIDERVTLVFAFSYKGKKLEKELDSTARRHLGDFSKQFWRTWALAISGR